MHRYSETKILPYSPAQLFAMVVDIEKYPQFLPWCRGARIISREASGTFLGELIISFSHLTERYTSRVTPLAPALLRHSRACPENPSEMDPRNESEDDGDMAQYSEGRIDVALVTGPFNHLNNHWRFVPHPEGCEIHLDLDFEFKSKLLDRMIGGLFSRASAKMVSAFTARAHALYGGEKPA